MALLQSTSTMLAVFISLLLINWHIDYCQSQHYDPNNYNDGIESRAYTPESGGLLDFVYHNHDDMTRFLR